MNETVRVELHADTRHFQRAVKVTSRWIMKLAEAIELRPQIDEWENEGGALIHGA